GQQKSVCVLELQGKSVELSRINVPVFQKLRTVGGSWDSIRGELLALVREGESVWAEVVLEGDDGPPDLAKCVHELVADSGVEVLRIKHERQNADPWDIPDGFVNLDDIRPEDVFSRFLDANNCEGERRERLTRTFLEMLSSMAGQDPEATN
ncbi:MAG TPA: exonuclease SbcCD subunit D C-terminal domain-containing protein, partial [Opitutales bacterium]|nr:exonuclease SbcCD subunit D C-terminal domain-containing protein [Opitutales bacterium]